MAEDEINVPKSQLSLLIENNALLHTIKEMLIQQRARELGTSIEDVREKVDDFFTVQYEISKKNGLHLKD